MASQMDITDDSPPDFDTWLESLANDGFAGSYAQSWETPERLSANLCDLNYMTEPFSTSSLEDLGQVATNALSNEHAPSFADWVPDWGNTPEPSVRSYAAFNVEGEAVPAQKPPHTNKRPAVKRKPQPRIPSDARILLEEQYAQSPYPAADQLNHLAEQTGLPIRKIKNWFSNTRSRRDANNNSRESTTSSNASRMPLTRRSLEKLSQESQSGQLPPMEAWASSSLHSEAPSVSAIEAAADHEYDNGNMNHLKTLKYPKPSRTPSIISSMASSAASSLASASTSYSMSSRGSFASGLSTRSRRRGRRTLQTRQAPYVKSKLEITDREPQSVYWCTFANCNKRFTTHYEWVRHEESIHVPRQTWICCLDDDPYSVSYHCKDKDEESRTFFRQDQFVQHLHAIHFSSLKHPSPNLGCSKGSSFGCAALVERWRRPAPALEKHDPLLHCGFCGVWLSTWEERRSHVSQHFRKEKKQLSSWWERRAPQVFPDEREVAGGRVRCRYCCQVFEYRWLHATCPVWSCRFPLDRDPVQHGAISLFVENSYASDQELLRFWQDHGVSYFFHNAECEQEIYRTAEDFFQHLESSHKATTSCRLHADTLKRYFFREVQAAFQPVYANTGDLASAQLIPQMAAIPPSEVETQIRIGASPSIAGIQQSCSRSETSENIQDGKMGSRREPRRNPLAKPKCRWYEPSRKH